MFLEQSNYTWEKIDENLDRAVVGFDDSLMLTIVRFKKGGIGKLHQHIHSQAAYIASGSFEVQIDENKKPGFQIRAFFIGYSKKIPLNTLFTKGFRFSKWPHLGLSNRFIMRHSEGVSLFLSLFFLINVFIQPFNLVKLEINYLVCLL